WQELPEAERRHLDDLGKYNANLDPSPPAGGLILKVYARGLYRDADGHLQIYRTSVARSLEAGRDHLWLTAADAKTLLPTHLQEGEADDVPQAIVMRICRRCLIDLVRVGGNGGPRRADEVLSQTLRSTVERASPTDVRLRLDGSAKLATHDAGSGARGKDIK